MNFEKPQIENSINHQENLGQVEQKERLEAYDPVKEMDERDIMPEYIYRDKEDRPVVEDKDLLYILAFLRKNIKEGSVLNLGSGFTHFHQMCAIADKATSITGVEIAEENNRLATDILESSIDLHRPRVTNEEQADRLRIVAEYLGQNKDFGINQEGADILKAIHRKSSYKGKLDIIESDMYEQADRLGSGEMTDGRQYDNIMYLFSSFTRTREETLAFLKSARERLKDGGRLLVLDSESYGDEDDSVEDSRFGEAKIVSEKYNKIWDWTQESFREVLEEAGFRNIKIEIQKISSCSSKEQEEFSNYLGFIAER